MSQNKDPLDSKTKQMSQNKDPLDSKTKQMFQNKDPLDSKIKQKSQNKDRLDSKNASLAEGGDQSPTAAEFENDFVEAVVNFTQPWDVYKKGFGDVNGEYFIGEKNYFMNITKSLFHLYLKHRMSIRVSLIKMLQRVIYYDRLNEITCAFMCENLINKQFQIFVNF